MRLQALPLALPLIALLASAQTMNVCDRYKSSDLIFTGSAESAWETLLDTWKSPVHKRSEKSRRVGFFVREAFKGVQADKVELWMTPADCRLTLEVGQTYLVYAKVNHENGRVESNGCMGTTVLASAASDLSYLRGSSNMAERATRVSGVAGAPGRTVKAVAGMNIRWAVADASGNYAFDGLTPGDWDLSVDGGPVQRVHVEPGACLDAGIATSGK